MANIEKAVIARLCHGTEVFEILVKEKPALEFKKGGSIPMDEILEFPVVFKDSKKGEKAQESRFKEVFGTTDIGEIAKKIIIKGKIQISNEYKKELTEEKKKAIIDTISRNAVDPKTNLPHPPKRIELALEQIKMQIDPFSSAEEQVNDIMKSLARILPISFERRKVEVTFPPSLSGSGFGIIKAFGKVLKDRWNNDGSRTCEVELPAGLQEELIDKLNKLTKGSIDIKIAK